MTVHPLPWWPRLLPLLIFVASLSYSSLRHLPEKSFFLSFNIKKIFKGMFSKFISFKTDLVTLNVFNCSIITSIKCNWFGMYDWLYFCSTSFGIRRVIVLYLNIIELKFVTPSGGRNYFDQCFTTVLAKLDIVPNGTNTPCILLNHVHLGTNEDTRFLLDTIFIVLIFRHFWHTILLQFLN